MEFEISQTKNLVMNYDKSGNITGFYNNQMHGDNIPKDAKQISEDLWQWLLTKQGKYRVNLAGIDGKVVLTKADFIEIQAAEPLPQPKKLTLDERLQILENKTLLESGVI